MPIYEYRCEACGRRPSIFFTSFAAVDASPACPHCGAHRLTRLISVTAQVLSEESRLERLDDHSLGAVDENDPASMARWARTMGEQVGDQEMGEDFGEAMDEMGESAQAEQSDLNGEP